MSTAVLNGEIISGSTNYASAINYKKNNTTTSVQSELDNLNSKSLKYNAEDDYIYINNKKWLYAGLQAYTLIPKLTSNTGTNGKVVYTSAYTSSAGLEPWRAFDGNGTTFGLSNNGATTGAKYLGYQFNTKKKVSQVKYVMYQIHAATMTITTTLEYYDGVNWISLTDTARVYTYISGEEKVYIEDFIPFDCYGIRVSFSSPSSMIGCIAEMQIYGTSLLSNNNENPEVVTGVVTTTYPGVVVNSLTKRNNNVEIFFNLSNATAISSTETVIGTIPEEFRPSVDVYTLGRGTYNKTTWIPIVYKISSTGNITMAEYANNTSDIGIFGNYNI